MLILCGERKLPFKQTKLYNKGEVKKKRFKNICSLGLALLYKVQ